MDIADQEFREVGHSGGKVIVHVVTTEGRRKYSMTWTHCRPVRTVVAGVWALPQGMPLCRVTFGGIGTKAEGPPAPRAIQVFLASDSQGHFGHECPGCAKYWRSGPAPLNCPYCGGRGDLITFLTQPQRRYIQQYCRHVVEAIQSETDGDFTIDGRSRGCGRRRGREATFLLR